MTWIKQPKAKSAKNKKKPAEKKAIPIRGPLTAHERERIHTTIGELLARQGCTSVEEANAFLERHVNGKTLDRLELELGSFAKDDPWETAYDLLEQSSLAETPEEALALLAEAVEIDPLNIDVMLEIVEVSEELGAADWAKSADMLLAIVEGAAELLGAQCFADNKGEFWHILETRPYMRARDALVQRLILLKRHDDAIGHCMEMLELNSNDNQGLRYLLISLYLEAGRLEEAERLFARYPTRDGCDAQFAWARVLWHLLLGEQAAALAALRPAVKANRFVADYLTGRKPLPPAPPVSYRLGSREEAQSIFGEQFNAWNAHPAALAWLGKQRVR